MLEPATGEIYNFRFSAGRGFRRKLERLAEVLGARDPVRHMGEILEKAVDCLLERKDPERRRARRSLWRRAAADILGPGRGRPAAGALPSPMYHR